MSQHQNNIAAEMLLEDTGHSREGRRIDRIIFAVIALCWALFQLALPRFIILDSMTVRIIHLAFAVVLVYLSIPALKDTPAEIRFIQSKEHVPLLDYILAIIAGFVIIYMIVDWQGITARQGRPIMRDIIISAMTMVLLFEAARRIIGLPMGIISLVFTIYAFSGPYMPSFLAFRGVSLNKYVSQIVLSTEGIYGIPLDVSANTVFLFVLFGSMLDRLGAGKFFNEMSIAIFGRFTGGPAKAAVISSGMTGLVSGSSIANVVTTGTFTIPLMKRVGYPGKTAAATEVAASTNGQLMPPIMGAAAFIIAEYLGISYFEVIKSAFLPAFVSYIALFYIIHLEALKLDMKGLPDTEVPDIKKVLREGYYYLIPLFILIFELAVMRHSPNLSVFNAIVILSIILFVRDGLAASRKKESVLRALKNSCGTWCNGAIAGSRNMLSVALATAMAGIIVGIVNMGIGSMIVQVVEILSAGNIFLMLVITAIVSLLIGMGLPTTATYIVMATITVPVITSLGDQMGLVIPAIAAHLFCFYFGILADDTPPVGLAAYAASAIAESDPIATGIKGFSYDMRTALIPFIFIFNSEMLLLGVDSIFQVVLISIATTIGVLAITNIMQMWFLTKIRLWEVPGYVLIALITLLPVQMCTLMHIPLDYRYMLIIPAVALYAMLYMLHRKRPELSTAA